MNQDFSKKLAIIVRQDLPQWQILNAIAHISAYIGYKLGNNFGTGEFFLAADSSRYPRNSQYPFIILAGNKDNLKELWQAAEKTDFPRISFIREMIETTDDNEIEKILSTKTKEEIEPLGIGIFGPKEEISTLTKEFPLFK